MTLAATPQARVYTVTDLLALLPGYAVDYIGSRDLNINNHGEIVGRSDNATSSVWYYYHDGMIQKLTTPTGVLTVLTPTINDQGAIVGTVAMPGSRVQFRDVIGTKERLSYYSPPRPYTNARIYAINNKGEIAAWAASGGKDGSKQRFLDRNGMPPQALTDVGYIRALNDRGEMLTDQLGKPGIWSTGTWTPLPARPNCHTMESAAINESGEVTGFLRDIRLIKNTAFLYRDGILTDLLPPPGFTDSEGKAINAAGTVVGLISVHPMEQPFVEHAAIFVNGRGTDLNTLIGLGTGWELTRATGINDKGQIIGDGKHNGQPTSFLLTPIKK
jgi:uncharacterized membrane protein